MAWTFSTDVEPYAQAAGPLLRADPAAHTISLTVLEAARARRGDDEIFGWWTDPGGTVTGAVSHTAPHPLLLGVVPDEAIRSLIDELSGRRPEGVNGSSALAAQVAAVWTSVVGGRAELGRTLRLYRLGTLRTPDPLPPGRARLATEADVPLLIDWITAFHGEATEPAVDVARAVVDRLDFGGWMLWENGAGAPVSVAGHTRTAAGAVRVAPVYTPPAHRRHGWAAAVTAAVSAKLLASGASEVLLFTDLTNPTSNGIYQRIGYEPVADRLVLNFRPDRRESDARAV